MGRVSFEERLEAYRQREFKRTLKRIERRKAQERREKREQAKALRREARRARAEAKRAQALAERDYLSEPELDEETAQRRAKKNALMKALRARRETERRALLDIRNVWRNSVTREALIVCGWPSVSMTWIACFSMVKQWRDS